MISFPSARHAGLVHYAFEWLAFLLGAALYRAQRRAAGAPGLTERGSFGVVVGCLLGAGLGNKLAFWLENPAALYGAGLHAWLDGQSLVGGLLGGWLGVECGKRFAGVTARTGDLYVRPLLVGIAVGRIGCFLAGLHDGTYGLPTALPWGVDFGDGVPRHPTQVYELALAALAALTWRRWSRPLAATPGLAFRAFLIGYLLWRLAIDALKPVPRAYALGLSGIQWVCIVGLMTLLLGLWRDRRAVRP